MAKKKSQVAKAATSLSDPPQTFEDSLPLPKLIVFDIDYTLWPGSPKVNDECTFVTDSTGEHFAFYDEVPAILQHCRAKGLQTAIASRTCDPGLAQQILGMLKIWPDGGKAEEFFDYKTIWPGDKREHFRRLHKDSGVDYQEMLFFDDESRNKNVEKLGVVMRLVRDGMTLKEVDQGVKDWRKKNGRIGEESQQDEGI